MMLGVYSRRLAFTLLALAITRPLVAQCPDGAPPPCAAERRARQEALRRAAANAPDSASALVVPLSAVGTDPALRHLAMDFAGIVADNMTVGEVRARVADDLGRLFGPDRLRAAAQRRAGAVVDGSIMKIGANVRVTVRLVAARNGREIAVTTVQGSQDSLLALAEQASVVLLKAWWKEQPGPRARGGLTTSSLPALRYYVAAMAAWRRGGDEWVALLDSAVRRDADFVAAWLWLGLPRPARTFAFGLEEGLGADIQAVAERLSPDSARRALARVLRTLPSDAQREAQSVASFPLIWSFDAGGLRPPTPRSPDACDGGAVPPTIEERYLVALVAREAALLGCSDTVVVSAARRAVELDSRFTPAWHLLFDELLASGDTAGAQALILRFPGADTTTARNSRQSVAMRFAVPAVLAAIDSGGFAGWLFIAWHRFTEQSAPAVQLRRTFALLSPDMATDRFQAGMRVYFDLPTFVALGQLDSARSVLRAGLMGMSPGSGAFRQLLGAHRGGSRCELAGLTGSAAAFTAVGT